MGSSAEVAKSEALRAAEEETAALEAAKALAQKAAAIRLAAERAAMEATEAEAKAEQAAMREAEEAFPTLGQAEEKRREEEEAQRLREREEAERLRDDRLRRRAQQDVEKKKLLERLSAEGSAPLFGPASSTSLGKKAQRQVTLGTGGTSLSGGLADARSPRSSGDAVPMIRQGGWADMDEEDDEFFRGPPVFTNKGADGSRADEVDDWRRRDDSASAPAPTPFVPAPVPLVSAWAKTQAAAAKHPASAPPSGGAGSMGSAGPRMQRRIQQSLQRVPHISSQRAAGTWVRDDWGTQGSRAVVVPRDPSGPKQQSLMVIQAQQEGGEDARHKLETLVDMVCGRTIARLQSPPHPN